MKPISGNSKIPLGAKQERLVSLQKCLVESNGEFSLHLQSYDEKPSVGDDESCCSNYERAPIRNETKRSGPEFVEPAPRKIPKQTTIESAFKIRTDRPADPLDAARGRVHLYSPSDIERASDGRKEYYTFWNTKAQELCSDRNFNGYKKQELHGVIDTAWQMRSCDILTARVQADIQDKAGLCTKTVTKNIKRVQEAKRVANELNLEIRQLKRRSKEKGGRSVKEEILKNEEKLSDAMSEVKLALDALRKSFKKLKKTELKCAKPVVAEDENLVNGDESEEEIKYSDEEIDIDLQEVEELAEEAKENDDDW